MTGFFSSVRKYNPPPVEEKKEIEIKSQEQDKDEDIDDNNLFSKIREGKNLSQTSAHNAVVIPS